MSEAPLARKRAAPATSRGTAKRPTGISRLAASPFSPAQAFLPSYLELSLATFAEQQERMRAQFASIGQGGGLGAAYEEQIRQNLAMFDRAMKMFSPFAYTRPDEAPPAPKAAPEPAASDETLTALKKQMAEMQAQIEKLAKR